MDAPLTRVRAGSRPRRGRIADDVVLLVLRDDRTRASAQTGDTALRRTRPEPSNR
ncbi:hypothetical protein ABZ208_20850 [Streptomyces sp. NPDC006208]|uniref:hypothetical protein n=1 Tax=Streptomyces sp. NPDC006208 TaxID=3156734 RepID=UPI0033A98B49